MKKCLLWFVVLIMSIQFISFADDDALSKLNLSSEEWAWLEDHPIIRVGPEDDYAPVEYKTDDGFTGLSIDFLKWIEDEYGLKFEYIYYETWPELLEALKKDEIDLQTAIVKTPDRSEYAVFTESYVTIPNVVLKRKDFNERVTIDHLFDYKVGVIGGYSVHEYIGLVYAPDHIYEFDTVKDALSNLSFENIDFLILDLAQASHYIQEMGITNVTIANNIKIDFDYKVSFGAPKSSEALVSIMNKIIASMPQDVKQSYYDKWISFGHFMNVSNEFLNIMLAAAITIAIIILLVVIWNYHLRRAVKNRTMALENFMNKLEVMVDERTKSLEAANEKIIESEKINSVSRLILGIAHEINTPLGNSIMLTSYISKIISEEEHNLTPNQFERLQHIQAKLTYSLEDISELIATFKMASTGSYEQSFKRINLSKEIEDIVNALRMHVDYGRLNYQLEIEENIMLYTSRICFYQILSELCSNVYDHAYNKSEGLVIIKLYKEDKKVILTLQDKGAGIEHEFLQRMFEPFNTTKREDNHVGFGLYSIYNLVTNILKGGIHVDTSLDNGTLITIEFEDAIDLDESSIN